jgi:hypothetical protein
MTYPLLHQAGENFGYPQSSLQQWISNLAAEELSTSKANSRS